MNRDSLRALLVKSEDLRLLPYVDCCGKDWKECKCVNKGLLTIGVGRCLDTVGISEAEANYLLENDMSTVVAHCRGTYPWFNGLDDSRQNAICSLVFNMGAAKFMEFKKLIAAVSIRDWETASNELLCSKYAAQVGQRAVDLAKMLKNGDTLN